MIASYDDTADALYLRLREGVPVARSVIVDEGRVVDLDADGHAVGIEVLGASEGVHLTELVERFSLRPYLTSLRKAELATYTSIGFA